MFEKISLQQQRTTDAENPLDLAFLAEAMLFYGRVEILLNRGLLQQVIREVGPDLLLELVNRGYLHLKFEPNFTGIYTENTGTPLERHLATVAQIEGQQLIDVLRPLVISVVGKDGKGRRLAQKLANQIASAPIDEELSKRFAADLTAHDFIANGAKIILETSIPGISIPTDFRFEAVPLGENKFRIDTDLDFASLNKRYHQRVAISHSSLSSAYVLSLLLTARKMLEDGARDECEIAVAPVYSALISSQVANAVRARNRSERQIREFQEFVFEDGRSLAGVFAAKERNFRDLLPLLDKASKFRDWLKDQEPNSTLVKEYFRAVTEESWVDKLPTRAVRWSLFYTLGLAIDAAGAGGVGTAASLLVSAADALFLDKILKGWRPNQFVEDTLRTFINKT